MARITALAVAALILAAWPSEASAWFCRAGSATGAYGWGRSVSLYRAQRIALWQCAIRTPRGVWCHIRYCH